MKKASLVLLFPLTTLALTGCAATRHRANPCDEADAVLEAAVEQRIRAEVLDRIVFLRGGPFLVNMSLREVQPSFLEGAGIANRNDLTTCAGLQLPRLWRSDGYELRPFVSGTRNDFSAQPGGPPGMPKAAIFAAGPVFFDRGKSALVDITVGWSPLGGETYAVLLARRARGWVVTSLIRGPVA